MKSLKKETLIVELKKRCNWFIEQTKDDFESDYNTCNAVFYDDVRRAYYTETDMSAENDCSLITIGDDDLDEFADEHGFTIWQDEAEKEYRDAPAILLAIEDACDCEFHYKEEGGYEIEFRGERR